MGEKEEEWGALVQAAGKSVDVARDLCASHARSDSKRGFILVFRSGARLGPQPFGSNPAKATTRLLETVETLPKARYEKPKADQASWQMANSLVFDENGERHNARKSSTTNRVAQSKVREHEVTVEQNQTHLGSVRRAASPQHEGRTKRPKGSTESERRKEWSTFAYSWGKPMTRVNRVALGVAGVDLTSLSAKD